MRIKFAVWVSLFLHTIVLAQSPLDRNTTIVNGYQKKISGNDFRYHSSIPIARESLLIRATDGTSNMEWETAASPTEIKTETISFVWLAGIGSSPGKANFDLAVNEIKKFTFWADGSDQWLLKNDDGSSLWFQKDMIDQHGDRFGFMVLTLPVQHLQPGKSLNLKVTGGRFEKTSWYMTFQLPLENGFKIRALPALIQVGEKLSQLGIAGILHFGDPATARVFVDNMFIEEVPLKFGYNHVRIQLPAVQESMVTSYRIEMDNQVFAGKLELDPVRKWRVNFVQHTHTDIGYTRPQTEILAEHLRFIDYALDYCDNTDNYPDDAKFRWTCEASWAVDEYLRSRPSDQINRLKKRVNERRIEITGMYFNFSELPDEQTLTASLLPLKRFKDNELKVKTAMQNDVNGIAWCLNDYYHDMGVKYLNMGTHGHRALICFDIPTLFWWESASGKRMLAYRGEHYMIGNTLFKIHSGEFDVFEDELLTYLSNLESKGYSYDLISLQHSGFITDNSPPSTLPCEMIRKWNEKYIWPKLRTASATEFFEEMEEKYGDSLQVIRGAWPDWWTDGFGGSAREVAALRQAQNDLIANTSGLTMAIVQGSLLPEKISDRIEAVNSALLFYAEHTAGYHASVREPFHINTMEQRAIKESYAWEASRKARMLGEEALGLLQHYVSREKSPSLVVYNSLSWCRSGLLTVYIDHQTIPGGSHFDIYGQDGIPAKAQPIKHHSDGTYYAIWVNDVPAFGYKKYVITVKEEITNHHQDARENTFAFENQWYKIIVNPQEAVIESITDLELNRELVDKQAAWKLGEFIYELPENREQMESFSLHNFTREALDKAWFEAFEPGDVWNTVRFGGNTRAAVAGGTYYSEIRIFNTTKRIDLVYSIEKRMVTEPEGIYISFPFILEQAQIAFDVPGGEIRAGIDQIPGSSNDWNTVQSYARLSNEKMQIVLCSPQIPLMQFGGINTGRYKSGSLPESTHIFGWPMNNYWTTNFNADQHGGHTWIYTMTSRAGNSMTEASRFGMENRIPFLARVLPAGNSNDVVRERSFITGWPDNLLLISAIPDADGKSAVLHVRETAGKSIDFNPQNGITGAALDIVQLNVIGNIIENAGIEIRPFESRFFRVHF